MQTRVHLQEYRYLDKGVYVTKLICISYTSNIKSSSLTLLKVCFKVPDQFVQMQTRPTSLSRCSRPTQPVCPDADPPNQFVQMGCSRPSRPVCPDAADPPNQFVKIRTHPTSLSRCRPTLTQITPLAVHIWTIRPFGDNNMTFLNFQLGSLHLPA